MGRASSGATPSARACGEHVRGGSHFAGEKKITKKKEKAPRSLCLLPGRGRAAAPAIIRDWTTLPVSPSAVLRQLSPRSARLVPLPLPLPPHPNFLSREIRKLSGPRCDRNRTHRRAAHGNRVRSDFVRSIVIIADRPRRNDENPSFSNLYELAGVPRSTKVGCERVR